MICVYLQYLWMAIHGGICPLWVYATWHYRNQRIMYIFDANFIKWCPRMICNKWYLFNNSHCMCSIFVCVQGIQYFMMSNKVLMNFILMHYFTLPHIERALIPSRCHTIYFHVDNIIMYPEYTQKRNTLTLTLDDLDLDQFCAPGTHITWTIYVECQKCKCELWPWVKQFTDAILMAFVWSQYD